MKPKTQSVQIQVGKRYLVGDSHYETLRIPNEYTIIEISPSHVYAKIKDQCRGEFLWMKVSEIKVLEEFPDATHGITWEQLTEKKDHKL